MSIFNQSNNPLSTHRSHSLTNLCISLTLWIDDTQIIPIGTGHANLTPIRVTMPRLVKGTSTIRVRMKCLSESTSTMCHSSASPCCHSANPRPMCQSNDNPLPNKFQSSPIYSQSVRTSRIELRERVLCGPTTLKTPSFSELMSRFTTMSIHGHFCKSNKNPFPICTSMINPLPFTNPMSILDQSSNQSSICRSYINPMPIQDQSANQSQINQYNANRGPIYQSPNPSPIQQYDANPGQI